MSTLRPEQEIGVFARGTRTSGIPSHRISYEDAEWMVKNLQIARWVNNRRKSIIMTKETADCKVRGVSCQMGWKVIVAYLLGEKYALEAVGGWAR